MRSYRVEHKGRSSFLWALFFLLTTTPVFLITISSVYADTLSAKERVRAFEEVWHTVNERYYDPAFNGIDWNAIYARYRAKVELTLTDQEFYDLLARMVGELRDSHTRFRDPFKRQLRERVQKVTVGLALYEIENKPVVVAITPNSEAARANIKPGMILESIEGRPVAERIAELRALVGESASARAARVSVYGRLLEGEPGLGVLLGFMRGDGSRFYATLTRQLVSDSAQVEARRLPSGYGYIKLTRWQSPISDRFKEALKGLKDAPGIILDLRGNPGGEIRQVLKIAGYFIAERVSFGHFTRRPDRRLETFAGGHGERIFSGPLAIIVSEASGSGSELFSGVMQELKRATVIGEQSCGCVQGVSNYKKVAGGELSVSELGYYLPSGRKIEGAGVTPDLPVTRTLKDLESGVDAALSAAEKALTVAAGK